MPPRKRLPEPKPAPRLADVRALVQHTQEPNPDIVARLLTDVEPVTEFPRFLRRIKCVPS